MKAPSRIAIGLVVAFLAGGAVVLILWRPSGAGYAPASALAVPAPAGPAAPSDERGFLGVVVAGESVEVAARLSGLVTAVHVRLGDTVAQDGIIATLDDQPLRAELAIARAALAAALSAAHKASLEADEANERLDRWQRTAEASVVSPEELAGLRYKAQYAAEELKAARARVAEQEARVKNLERQLAETTVRAPFAGRVAARYIDTGANVQNGQPIVRLLHAGELRVRFAVPEARGAEVQRGQAVEVRVDELGTAVAGIVESVAPEIDAASRMIIAEARLEATGELAEATMAGRVARVHPRPKIQP